jgi:hypothetical protein
MLPNWRILNSSGYPDSYLAPDNATSTQWCEDFITSYVERYLPQLGVAASPQQLRRLCTMLSHQQGASLNLSKLGGSLGIDGKTARHYLDLLEGLYLLRTLPAWSRNAGKRLVKAPKVYWRDTGLLHALAGLPDIEKVLGHPLCGHSWYFPDAGGVRHSRCPNPSRHNPCLNFSEPWVEGDNRCRPMTLQLKRTLPAGCQSADAALTSAFPALWRGAGPGARIRPAYPPVHTGRTACAG